MMDHNSFHNRVERLCCHRGEPGHEFPIMAQGYFCIPDDKVADFMTCCSECGFDQGLASCTASLQQLQDHAAGNCKVVQWRQGSSHIPQGHVQLKDWLATLAAQIVVA